MVMTTTEPPRRSPSPTGATNLRRYLVGLLASAYVLAWCLFSARAPAGSTMAPPPTRTPELDRQPRLAAWFHDLPPAQRPQVDVPAGWHIADPAAAPPRVTRRDVPVPARASPARVGRIRTRSS